MTKAELIDLIKSIPDHYDINVQAMRGVNTDTPAKGMYYESTWNGSATITIEIGGGARNTQTRSGLYAAMSGRPVAPPAPPPRDDGA